VVLATLISGVKTKGMPLGQTKKEKKRTAELSEESVVTKGGEGKEGLGGGK